MSFIEIKRIKKRFSDVDLSFVKHPITGDVSKRLNEKAIIFSIKNLVFTKVYGRPFHPEISSDVYSLLFENITPSVLSTLNTLITNVINNFEPRVELQLVECKPSYDKAAIEVMIIFKIIGTTENIKTQFLLQRTL